MDTEKKKCFLQGDPSSCHGYVAPGQEKLDNLKEEPGEKATMEVREAFDCRDVTKEDKFPKGMKKAFGDLIGYSMKLNERVLTAIAVSLKLEPNFFVRRHGNFGEEATMTMIRSLYYPPITGTDTLNYMHVNTYKRIYS